MASSLTKDSVTPGTPGSERTFFGHPRGLATLFMTEMWERFSYYGMKALLPLYLVAPGGLHLSAATATAIYSVYLSLVYLLALPGGWFADRVLGPRKTVAVAGVIIMLGHLTLALPSSGTFYGGLGLVAIGSGLLKADISTMVGHLYDGPDDPRRDGGFTLFYIGIDARRLRRSAGHRHRRRERQLAPGLRARRARHGAGSRPVPARRPSPQARTRARSPRPLSAAEKAATLRKSALWAAVAVVFYCIVGFSGHYTLNWLLVPITIAGLIIPVMVIARIKRDKDLDRAEQSKMSAYIWFFVAAAVFWMIYDQGGLDHVDLRRLLRREHDLRLGVPGLLVPVRQPGHDHGARAGVRLGVAGAEQARQGAEHGDQVRFGSDPDRCLVLPVPCAADDRRGWSQGGRDVAGARSTSCRPSVS